MPEEPRLCMANMTTGVMSKMQCSQVTSRLILKSLSVAGVNGMWLIDFCFRPDLEHQTNPEQLPAPLFAGAHVIHWLMHRMITPCHQVLAADISQLPLAFEPGMGVFTIVTEAIACIVTCKTSIVVACRAGC